MGRRIRPLRPNPRAMMALCFIILCFTCPMLIDCHVHVSALLPDHGLMSAKILKSFPFRFMQSRLGIRYVEGQDEATERALTARLFQLLDDTRELDAAVILAFDAVFTKEGIFNV